MPYFQGVWSKKWFKKKDFNPDSCHFHRLDSGSNYLPRNGTQTFERRPFCCLKKKKEKTNLSTKTGTHFARFTGSVNSIHFFIFYVQVKLNWIYYGLALFFWELTKEMCFGDTNTTVAHPFIYANNPCRNYIAELYAFVFEPWPVTVYCKYRNGLPVLKNGIHLLLEVEILV